MRILIAEDNQTDRQLLGSYVQNIGHTPELVSNGQEAVKRFQENRPDLILLDVEMPVMSGYEAAKAIRELGNGEEDWVPIIFLSSHMDEDSLVQEIESGGDDYLTKPVSRVVLKAKINAMKRITLMKENLIEVSTQLRSANEKLLTSNLMLADLSLKDPLTGLGNRRAFEETIERELKGMMRRGSILSLIMIDIDNFKPYNDTNGHQLGDVCLQMVGQVIKSQLKRATDFVARFGGEEFAIIMPDTTLEGAVVVAEAIRNEITLLKVSHRGKQMQGVITLSIGVAATELDMPVTSQSIVADADIALYAAKRQGKNRVIVFSEFLEQPFEGRIMPRRTRYAN